MLFSNIFARISLIYLIIYFFRINLLYEAHIQESLKLS